MLKTVLTNSASASTFYSTSGCGSRSIRLSRTWDGTTDTARWERGLKPDEPKTLETVVNALQQSGLPGPLILINDREYLGQGNQFIVYKQRMAVAEYDNFATREIAVKKPKFDLHPDTKLSLSDEAARKHLSDIFLEVHSLTIPTLRSHPNIARLFGWSTEAYSFHGPPLLIMELAESDLLSWLSSCNISEDAKHCICCDVGAGLDALHDNGLVHGDLKPENVLMFRSRGRITAKLADFGLSLNATDASQHDTMLGGTRGWMAPEVERGEALEPLTLLRADNYSFGLLAWSIALHSGTTPCCFDTVSQCNLAYDELRQAGQVNDHALYSILTSAVQVLLLPDPPGRPLHVSFLLGDRPDDGSLVIDDESSETSVPESSTRAPSPFANLRYFTWELHAFSYIFLDGLYSRLVDNSNSVAPEVLFSMFLAFSPYAPADKRTQEKALDALVAAATLGYEPAQAVAQRVYNFYQCSPPATVRDRVGDWLKSASASGSPWAQSDLYLRDSDIYLETTGQFRSKGGFNAFYSGIHGSWLVDDTSTCPEGYSYVHWLATYGSLSKMQEHLEMTAGRGINSLTSNGETALYLACARGSFDMVSELLNHGADAAGRYTNFDISPLHWTFAFDVNAQAKLVALLRDHGLGLNSRTSEPLPFFHFPFLLPAGTPLHWAVVIGSHTAIQTLIEHGSDVMERDGSDPYIWDDRVRILNKFGGPNQEAYSFSEVETQGLSPLDYAAIQNDPFIFETLLASRNNVNINAVDEEGFSVLHRLSTSHLACTRTGNRFSVRPFLGSHLERQRRLNDTVAVIKALGGDINLLTTPSATKAQRRQRAWSLPSYTPLMLALMNGSTDVARALIENGANVNAENSHHETAILCLPEAQESAGDDLLLECLQLLVSTGADINHRSADGATPVLRAAQRRLTDVVDYCLSVGASIDERDEDPNTIVPGRTVLQFLAYPDRSLSEKNDLALLGLLEKHLFSKTIKEHQRTIEAKDADGETIMHRLSSRGMLHCIRALLAHGAPVNALENCYTQDREDGAVYKVYWQRTPLDCAIHTRDWNQQEMERNRLYSIREYRYLAERDEAVIQTLMDAGGIQASKERRKKPLVFDTNRYSEGSGARRLEALREC